MSSIRRVLICRLSAVGDCIHTLPLSCALKDALGDVEVGWCIQSGAAARLLQGHRAVDHWIAVPRGWLKSPATVCDVRRRLRALRFDVALDVQSLTKSAAAGWLSGARRRIGFARPQGRELAPWLATERVTDVAVHVVEKYLELAAPLGVSTRRPAFDLPIDANAATTMREFALRACGGGYAVLNPGAGWDSKLWPAERFAAIALYLGQRHGLPSLVVWAGDRERAWADEIVAASAGHARLAPDTSLAELAALLRDARLMVASDTGPLHLAAAVDTPCIGLYGPTRPAVCGPYGAGHIALQAYLQEGSSRERRGTNNEALRAISVGSVAAACDELLSRACGARAM